MLNDALLQAASAGAAGEVQRLLAGGADPNGAAPGELTPLFAACLAGAEAAARCLLEYGADPNAPVTALNTELGHFESATALHAATSRRSEPLVQVLLSQGARAGSGDADGFTALHTAACWGHEGIARLLLAAGANPNAPAGLWARTPLMEAAWRGRWPVATQLVEAGASVGLRDAHGRTAADLAIAAGHAPPADLFGRGA